MDSEEDTSLDHQHMPLLSLLPAWMRSLTGIYPVQQPSERCRLMFDLHTYLFSPEKMTQAPSNKFFTSRVSMTEKSRRIHSCPFLLNEITKRRKAVVMHEGAIAMPDALTIILPSV